MGGSQRAGADGNELVLVALLRLLLPEVPARFRPSLSESVDSSSSAEDVEPPDVVSSLPLDVDCENFVVFFDVFDDESDLTEVGGDLPLPKQKRNGSLCYVAINSADSHLL